MAASPATAGKSQIGTDATREHSPAALTEVKAARVANQQRRERQRTAERRVEIGGAGGAGNEGRHCMGPREINYARMSDADILNL